MEYSKLATGLLILTFLKCTSSHAMVEELKKTFIPFWLRPEARSDNRSQTLQDVKGKTRVEETQEPKNAVTVREFLAANLTPQSSAVNQTVTTEPISTQPSPAIEPKALTAHEFSHQQTVLIQSALEAYKDPFEVANLLQTYNQHLKSAFSIDESNLFTINVNNKMLINQAKAAAEKAKAIFKKHAVLPLSNKRADLKGYHGLFGTIQPDIKSDVPSLETIQRNYICGLTNLDLVKEILKYKKHRKSNEKASKSENGKSCYN